MKRPEGSGLFWAKKDHTNAAHSLLRHLVNDDESLNHKWMNFLTIAKIGGEGSITMVLSVNGFLDIAGPSKMHATCIRSLGAACKSSKGCARAQIRDSLDKKCLKN